MLQRIMFEKSFSCDALADEVFNGMVTIFQTSVAGDSWGVLAVPIIETWPEKQAAFHHDWDDGRCFVYWDSLAGQKHTKPVHMEHEQEHDLFKNPGQACRKRGCDRPLTWSL